MATQRGENSAFLTGGAAAAVKDRAGVVATISVTATVTGSITVYDNPSAASGNLVYASAANPTIGTVIQIDFPCRKGIFVTPGSAGSIAVAYS